MLSSDKLYILDVDNSTIALKGIFNVLMSRVHGMLNNTPTTITIANNKLRFVYAGDKPQTSTKPINVKLYESF